MYAVFFKAKVLPKDRSVNFGMYFTKKEAEAAIEKGKNQLFGMEWWIVNTAEWHKGR